MTTTAGWGKYILDQFAKVPYRYGSLDMAIESYLKAEDFHASLSPEERARASVSAHAPKTTFSLVVYDREGKVNRRVLVAKVEIDPQLVTAMNIALAPTTHRWLADR